MANRTRKNQFVIRLTDEELEIFNAKWKLSHVRTRSAYIRQLILYGFVYNIDYSELRQYNTELSRIGNNINQIAHQANANGLANNADLALTKELMNKIWHTHKSMLSKQPLIKQ